MEQKVLEETEKLINNILEEGIKSSNLDYLDKLVDIHKDIKEEENMRYMAYGNYDREQYGADSYGRRARDSRGRYMTHHPGSKIDEMYMNYEAYSEGREQYGRSGNYGAKEDSMKSLEYMLECMVDFVKMLKQDAESQEEVRMIDKYIKKLSEI